jgi:hypothetical protein
VSLITLFSAPKPFTDSHIATIQHNAIKSWTLLPDVEVLLIGDEQGVAETAKELGVKHLLDVTCSEGGTPLISSMFQLARENSISDLLCIINADMILMSDFVEAAQQAVKLRDKFVLLSQRWDLDVAATRFFHKLARRSTVHGPRSGTTPPSRGERFLPIPEILLHRGA